MPPKYLCQTFDLNSILKCTFSLSDSELNVFLELIKCKKKECVLNLADKIKRDRSTVQKILLKLVEKNLVEKKRETLEDGGYIYYYFPKSKKELKDIVLSNLDLWHEGVKKEITKW